MRAFLEKNEKEWLDDFVYTVVQPLLDLGVEVIPFNGNDLKSFIEKYSFDINKDIIIGSVEATNVFFKECGIEVPKYLGYPECLKSYLGRKIIETKVKDLTNEFPYFIKPKNDVKLFTGTLVENENQLKLFKTQYPVSEDTELYLSEPLNFISEYRCFVHKNELQGIHWYKGNFKIFPTYQAIEEMIRTYKLENSPISYTLDVGVVPPSNHSSINKTNTVLIEVNDFWAIGGYGFDGKKYVRMTIDRFQEIAKLNRK